MADYPNTEGLAADFSSAEIDINGSIYIAITEVTYSQTLEPGIIRGTSAQKLARTRGEHDAEGSITMIKSDYHELIAALGDGYMEKSFNTTATYDETGITTMVDKLFGCRMKSEEDSHSQGTDGLTVSFDIDIMYIERDGLKAIANMLV